MVARVIAIIAGLLVLGGAAQAREIAGVELAERLKAEDGTVLHLNGAGIRYKFIFKIYIGALYLEHPRDEAAAVLADPGAKRLVMHFLYDEVDREALVEAWNEGFTGNATEAQLKTLAGPIETFNEMFTGVKRDDEVVLDYVPGSGTSVRIRGEEKGVIEGREFNDLLLSIWLGKEPVSATLRDELLGK